jgi:hypothetical protein
MEIEAQHTVEEWNMFSTHFLQSSPTIYQTTFEKLPQALAEQSKAPSAYRKNFYFFNPTPSESNIPVSNYQSTMTTSHPRRV